MEYNGEDIRKAQMEQRQRILKSFGETDLFSGVGDSNKLMRSMEKAEENDLEKARSGIYADNAENRRLGRVGQRYGSDGKQKVDEPKSDPLDEEENKRRKDFQKKLKEIDTYGIVNSDLTFNEDSDFMKKYRNLKSKFDKYDGITRDEVKEYFKMDGHIKDLEVSLGNERRKREVAQYKKQARNESTENLQKYIKRDKTSFHYLNTAGVPQVGYYSKTGETRSIGVNAPISSKIIKNIVSGKESDKKTDSKKKANSNIYASSLADEYDKGDGKIGNYPVPAKNIVVGAKILYGRLNNNRHFGFKYGMPSKEIMEKLKNHNGNVKYSYHHNAGTDEIYRIKFM